MTCIKKVLKFSRSSYRSITIYSFRNNGYSKVHWKTTLLCALTKKQSTYVWIESGTCKERYLHNNVIILPSIMMLACTHEIFSYGHYIDSSILFKLRSANRNILQFHSYIFFWLLMYIFIVVVFDNIWRDNIHDRLTDKMHFTTKRNVISDRKLYSHAC